MSLLCRYCWEIAFLECHAFLRLNGTNIYTRNLEFVHVLLLQRLFQIFLRIVHCLFSEAQILGCLMRILHEYATKSAESLRAAAARACRCNLVFLQQSAGPNLQLLRLLFSSFSTFLIFGLQGLVRAQWWVSILENMNGELAVWIVLRWTEVMGYQWFGLAVWPLVPALVIALISD